jgi:hypothetical protein
MSATTGHTREDLGEAAERRWFFANGVGVDMRLTRRVLLSSLTVAIVATSSAAAAGNPAGRPVQGTRTTTTTLDLSTGVGTSTTSGDLSHVGAFTGQATEQFIPTSATTFTFTGTATLVAANGDELFASFAGSAAVTSATTSTGTNTYTILGGTGRFAGASGTLTETINSTVVSIIGTTQTSDDTASIRGTISY